MFSSKLVVVFHAISCISFAFSQSSLQTEVRPAVKVMSALAGAFNTACVRILHSSVTNFDTQHETFTILRDLMRFDRLQTVASSSFMKYVDIDHGFKGKFQTCYKPLQIFEATNATQKEFSWMSQQIKLAQNLWVVFMKDGWTEDTFFADIPLQFDTHLLSVTLVDEKTPSYVIREVYRVNLNYPVQVVPVGEWSLAGGLQVQTDSIYHRRHNLQGLVLRTGSIENWPITSFPSNEIEPTKTLDGFFGNIWSSLEEQLNFTSMMYRSVDNSTGGLADDGKWNGLVGMLVNQQIDVIVSELNINLERIPFMDFSHPLLQTRYQVYFRLPGYSLSWTAVLKPFHWLLWLAVLGWLFVGAIGLTICYMGTRQFQRPSDLTLRPERSFFFMLQSMCQQGYSQVPDSWSCRVVFLLAYLMSAIIIPSYSASLISSLTAQTPNKPFDSLEGMLKYQRYKLVMSRNSAEYTHFSLSEDKIYSRVFKELVAPVFTSDQAFEHLCEHQLTAVFGVESTVDIRANELQKLNKGCLIIKFTQPLSIVYQSLGLTKGSHFTGLINFHISRMQSAGIVSRLQRRVWPLEYQKNRVRFKQVSPSEVFQVFLCLVGGIFLSTAILFVEITIASSRSRCLPTGVKRRTEETVFHERYATGYFYKEQ